MSTNVGVREAALYLKVSEQRIRTLCREGQLQSQKIGNTWVIPQESIDKYGLISGHTIAKNHSINDASINSLPIALSFFSGAMGLDLGIERSGFQVRLACEIDKYCRQTIALNRPDIALLSDINQYDAEEIRNAAGLSDQDEIDLIVGGPPCQAFSTAGKRQGLGDERGNVFLKYLDLALELKPKYFVIENVRGLLSCPMEHRPHHLRGHGYPSLSEDELKGGALNFIINKLNKSGYGYSFNLYNSANFGSPQIRERVIIICSRDGLEPPYLIPTHSEHSDFGLPKWKTLKSCISGIEEHNHLQFPEKRLRYYKLLSAGQNWRSLPEKLQKEALGKSYYSGGGKTGFLRRLAWNKPSPTLVTHPAMPATDLAHPEENRPLSIEEYKRIQGFPDKYQLSGPLIQQYKQIGNAVPIDLGCAIGSLIKKLIYRQEIKTIPNFNYSRYKNTSHDEWIVSFKKQIEKHNLLNSQEGKSICQEELAL